MAILRTQSTSLQYFDFWTRHKIVRESAITSVRAVWEAHSSLHAHGSISARRRFHWMDFARIAYAISPMANLVVIENSITCGNVSLALVHPKLYPMSACRSMLNTIYIYIKFVIRGSGAHGHHLRRIQKAMIATLQDINQLLREYGVILDSMVSVMQPRELEAECHRLRPVAARFLVRDSIFNQMDRFLNMPLRHQRSRHTRKGAEYWSD